MWLESQNFAIVQTELDEVFYQNFEYDAGQPGIATANTSALFKPMTIDRRAYIEEVYAGSALFPVVGEVQTVPTETPVVANKLTTPVLDFAQAVQLSKDLFDDKHSILSSSTLQVAYA